MHVPSVLLGITLMVQIAHAEDVTIAVTPKQPLIELHEAAVVARQDLDRRDQRGP